MSTYTPRGLRPVPPERDHQWVEVTTVNDAANHRRVWLCGNAICSRPNRHQRVLTASPSTEYDYDITK